MTVQEVLGKQEHEMIVGPGVTAKCINVGGRKTGVSQHGDWSLQPLQLEDQTGKINVIAWNRPDLSEYRDRMVTISATKGDKGWSGCLVELKEYQGKKYKQLKLAEHGTLEIMKAETHQNGNGAARQGSSYEPIPWMAYMEALRLAHEAAKELEPDDPQARAAIVNTMMIAFSNGKVVLPEGPIDDDIPF